MIAFRQMRSWCALEEFQKANRPFSTSSAVQVVVKLYYWHFILCPDVFIHLQPLGRWQVHRIINFGFYVELWLGFAEGQKR
jgi:hypothetical protein